MAAFRWALSGVFGMAFQPLLIICLALLALIKLADLWSEKLRKGYELLFGVAHITAIDSHFVLHRRSFIARPCLFVCGNAVFPAPDTA